MFWSLYVLSVICLLYLLSFYSREKFINIYFIAAVFLLTPAQLEVGSSDLAPALFTFIFNLTFEQDFSFRVLRPVLITLPISILGLLIFSILKRKFF